MILNEDKILKLLESGLLPFKNQQCLGTPIHFALVHEVFKKIEPLLEDFTEDFIKSGCESVESFMGSLQKVKSHHRSSSLPLSNGGKFFRRREQSEKAFFIFDLVSIALLKKNSEIDHYFPKLLALGKLTVNDIEYLFYLNTSPNSSSLKDIISDYVKKRECQGVSIQENQQIEGLLIRAGQMLANIHNFKITEPRIMEKFDYLKIERRLELEIGQAFSVLEEDFFINALYNQFPYILDRVASMKLPRTLTIYSFNMNNIRVCNKGDLVLDTYGLLFDSISLEGTCLGLPFVDRSCMVCQIEDLLLHISDLRKIFSKCFLKGYHETILENYSSDFDMMSRVPFLVNCYAVINTKNNSQVDEEKRLKILGCLESEITFQLSLL